MRVSTFSTYSRILAGLRSNQLRTLRAQEQLVSQRRILRPSDDPAGTSRSLALRRALARTERVQGTIDSGKSMLELAATTLEHGSGLMTRARELLLQGMNGTLSAPDREAIATELDEIRKQMLEVANLQIDGTFMFGGTRLGDSPFVEVTSGGRTHVVYAGNQDEQQIQTGEDTRVAITTVGERIFGSVTPGAVRFDGLTGVASGTTADEGRGYGTLTLRHDGTELGTLAGAGLALVGGGTGDTLLGPNTLTIDATAGTMRLNGGPEIPIPAVGARGDVVLENERGGALHLDLSAWNGLDVSDTVTGRGSISLDGTNFTNLDFGNADLELSDHTLGQVVHVDTRAILRAGDELVAFGETGNPFDLLAGMAEDLRNGQELDSQELVTRLSVRLDDIDRVHDDLLLGLGVVGARSARLASSSSRQGEIGLDLSARLSEVEDIDISEVALELTRSQTLLEVAQAASARVLQTSLLNFLG